MTYNDDDLWSPDLAMAFLVAEAAVLARIRRTTVAEVWCDRLDAAIRDRRRKGEQ